MADGIGRSLRPQPPRDFIALAADWCANQSALLLGFVWQAYDALHTDMPAAIDPDDLERSLTQLLEPRIRKAMSGDEPFYVQHGPYERESKMPPPAQPPQYDLAFVLYKVEERVDERVMWPLEAKILHTARAVNQYVADVEEQFLACRYAAFSSEAAMLGYLLSGDPEVAFLRIASRLHCRLTPHASFPNRPHRISRHNRTPPRGKGYPRRFTCHHLMLQFPSLAPEPELPLL
jgi:hypothetical protein